MIRIEDLCLWHGKKAILRNICLDIPPGCTLALIGESGGGKTSLALLLIGLLDGRARDGSVQRGFHWSGRAWVERTDILCAPSRRLRAMRGRDIALVIQGLSDALNPHLTVRGHLEECCRRHGLPRASVEPLCERHNIPVSIRDRYPAQLSGGEIQRVLIALALTGSPRSLILDEPTASLDQRSRTLAVEALAQGAETRSQLLITHDLALVRRMAHRVAVLRDGQIVDSGDTRQLLDQPRHPYTQELLRAMAPMPPIDDRSGAQALSGRLRVEGVCHAYGARSILRQIDFELPRGKCLAIMGASGSGKSTLARILAGFHKPDAGDVHWMGSDGSAHVNRAVLIPQHPHRAMARHFSVAEVLDEALRFAKDETEPSDPTSRKVGLLEQVGLPSDPSFLMRKTAVLSGGEAQRLVIARALACSAPCLIADEPTAALDAIARAKLLQLLRHLCVSHGVALVLFTHEWDVAHGLTDHVVHLARGRLRTTDCHFSDAHLQVQ